VNYQSLITFESDLRSYVSLLKRLSSEATEYWKSIEKRDLDLDKASTNGGKLLNNYMEFKYI
jgi:hypothetical protein